MKSLRKVSKEYLKQIVVWVLTCSMVFNTSIPVALGTPGGADVVAGSAGVSQSANTTTVNMDSARAVINWDSLNTSQNEALQFLKAGGGFAVLNRVLQGGATDFQGALFGNQGHIIIVNPAGIVFGPTAIVQAYKFTASSLNISNTDFMNGIYRFAGGNGAVINNGNITAQQVNLIGRQVLNAGTIVSPQGCVIMAAGDKVYLGQEGSDVVVEVEGVTVPEGTDAAAEGLGDVINEGTIEAEGGKIVLAAGDTFSRAIEGLDSLSVAVEGGTGRVGQFGTISTDAVEGDGGSVTLTAGNTVALSSESVTTANAGANGNGGEVIVYSPDTALFWEGAKIEAKGGSESGNGGFFELSGKQYTEIEGQIDMTASNGEAGTFLIDPLNIKIDNDGHEDGWFQGSTDTWHPSYHNNYSRLDVDDLEDYLHDSHVIVSTAYGGDSHGQTGWIKLDAGKDLDYDGHGNHDLTLMADDYIQIISGIDFSGSGNVTLLAGTYINVDATGTSGGSTYGIDLDSGTLTMDSGGGSPIYLFDDIRAGNIVFKDNVILDGTGFSPPGSPRDQDLDAKTGTLQAWGTINKSTAGNLTLAGDTLVDLDGTVSASNGSVTVDNVAQVFGDVTGTGVTFNGAVTANGSGGSANQTFNAGTGTLWAKSTINKSTAGNLTLAGDTLVDLDGTVSASNGSVTVDNVAQVFGDVTGTGVTFNGAVTANGSGGSANQTFNAGTGTLWAKSTINKSTAGNLTLAGDTLVDLDGTVSASNGSVTVDNVAQVFGDVTGTGVTFNGAVTANGSGGSANQTFNAGTGTLWAKKYDKQEYGGQSDFSR